MFSPEATLRDSWSPAAFALPLPKPGDYKSVRLNADMRAELKLMAFETLHTPHEEVAEAVAHSTLRALILDEVHPPEEDMIVLRRYGHTTRTADVTISDYEAAKLFVRDADEVTRHGRGQVGRVVCLCPRDVRKKPQRYGCDRQEAPEEFKVEVPDAWIEPHSSHLAIDKVRGADYLSLSRPWRTFVEATIATDEARRAILGPLRSLIEQSSTLQAVAKVWPDAMRLARAFRAIPVVGEGVAAEALKKASFHAVEMPQDAASKNAAKKRKKA